MKLPVMPPVKPMLAKSVDRIPDTGHYEPKWDGFRSIIFRDGDEVEIGSRNEKPMTRYFPEVVAAVLENLPERCVVDGEIVITAERGLDFEALQQRIHPADSRVRMLAETTPASFIAFDLLAIGDEDLTQTPFAERRARLVEALAPAKAPVFITPATDDRELAEQWFTTFEGAGLDGVMAKPVTGTYQPDKRTMFKIKHVRTADCVVAGYRVHKSGPGLVGSLLLGLYADDGSLSSVGVIGAFPMARRAELFEEMAPLVTTFDDHPWAWAEQEAGTRTPREGQGSRWNAGKDLSFVPLRPELVVEVRYDHMEGRRFRHTAQFERWRPDRDPKSCTYEQLEVPVRFALNEIVPGLGWRMTLPSLVGRWPELSQAELIDGLVPPPMFAAARFETYRPNPQHPSQHNAVRAAEALSAALEGRGAPKRGLLRKRANSNSTVGAYFDGGFGVGKTHLLASLWHAAPAPKAYATFVELTSLTGVIGMTATVQALSGHRLLAVDEFELDDPGDTVLMSTLLGRLAEHGVTLAATSNTQPEDLGEGRFAADDFRREIQGLASRFEVIRVDGPDYRDRGAGVNAAAPAVDSELMSRVQATPGATIDDFDALCGHLAELHPSRYGRLIDDVPLVALRDVRPLTDQSAALRFVVLVDRLYDRQVAVTFTGSPLNDLFPPELLTGPHRKKYQRALSRLGALSRFAGES